jgi:hypothetical protein
VPWATDVAQGDAGDKVGPFNHPARTTIQGAARMSDIGLDWGPLDWAEIALFVGAPGLVLGAMLGAVLWRRHRLWGAIAGAVARGWWCGMLQLWLG